MRKNKRKGRGVLLIALGLLLLAGSLGLYLYNLWDARRAAETALNVAVKLEEQILMPEKTITVTTETREEIPVVEVEDQLYMGLLEITALEILLPVKADWDYTSLKASPCRYSGTVEDGNLVIMAHNYSGHFGRLNQLSSGDVILFTAVGGIEYRYVVENAETLADNQVAEMITGDWDLSLFTCTSNGLSRRVVRCRQAG